ncbi:MAG TPA: FGGY-family carbohydrate kinase, partial [Ilumatobacteraceae bacterium]|nr:FGGY-family carbohydrate kinase [Ilumatobacteraceae bacterium]
FPPDSPSPGLVQFDAMALARVVLDVAHATIAAATAAGEQIAALGITAQRATTIVWDRTTGVPIGPAIGWQDLRTVIECIMAKAEHGLALAPNQSATKIGWLLANHAPHTTNPLRDGDAGQRGDLAFGTVDSWIAWVLSGGTAHITDHTNAAVTGLYDLASGGWSEPACAALGVPMEMLPTIVDSSGELAIASVLPGAPPICGLAGDQQASLVGQGCIHPGRAKITFGTGGMLDVCTGLDTPTTANRSANGTFPIVAWSQAGTRRFGTEAIMLSAGTNVEWLCDDMGLIETPADSDAVARQCDSTDGVVYVPALLGLGTPQWDYGARGALFGVTRGTTRAHVVRAVLEGVAQRGADLVESAEADFGRPIPALRIDGGMSQNPTFVQALADATQRPVQVSAVTEATTIGAGLLAGVAAGVWPSLDAVADSTATSSVVDPQASFDRDRWREAVSRTTHWIPDLSSLDF